MMSYLNYSWIVILILHFIVLATLNKHKSQNHPLLLPFFVVNAAIDGGFLLFSRQSAGGLELLNVSGLNAGGLFIWYATLEWLWLNWFWLIFWTAVYLSQGHNKDFSAKALVYISVLTTAALCLLWSFLTVYKGLLPVTYKKFFMHAILEPAILIGTFYFLISYLLRSYRLALPQNILCLAVCIIGVNLVLRLLLALQPNLMMVRSICHSLYITSNLVFLLAYFIDKKHLQLT